MGNVTYIGVTQVLDLPGLTTLDRAVWQALCSFARWDSPTAPQIGRCWPGLSELARRAGCAKCSLCRTLKRLESMNLLRRKQRPVMGGYKSTLYELSATPGVVSQGDSVSGIRGLSHCDTGVVSQGDKNITKNITENIKEYPPSQADQIPPSEAPTQTSPPAEPPTPWDTPSPQTEAPTPEGIPPKDEGAGGVSKITDSRNADNGEGETAERAKATTEAEHWAEVDAYFSQFWDGYPRKEGKADARAMFRKLFPPGKDPESYFARLREINERMGPFLDRAEELKRCGDQKFIPKPANWLKREFGDV